MWLWAPPSSGTTCRSDVLSNALASSTAVSSCQAPTDSPRQLVLPAAILYYVVLYYITYTIYYALYAMYSRLACMATRCARQDSAAQRDRTACLPVVPVVDSCLRCLVGLSRGAAASSAERITGPQGILRRILWGPERCVSIQEPS